MDSLNKAMRRTLLKLGGAAVLTDRELLARFVASQEQAAFEELMRRHGPMVLRVCQRVLHHAQDAEDAFQAAFIVLARQAAAVSRMESVGGWLHGVAYRSALNAKKQRVRRHVSAARELEPNLLEDGAPQAASEDTIRRELHSVLDEALHCLPEKYRAPLVLCYLEGKTNEEAARQLQCPTGTVKARLSRARDLLRSRLTRRGVAVSGGMLATLLSEETAGAWPAALVASTVKGATLIASGKAVDAGLVSARSVALADATIKAMAEIKWKIAAAILAALATVVGLGVVVLQSRPEQRAQISQISGISSTVVFSPDGKTLAAGRSDGTISLYDAASGNNTATFRGPANAVYSVAVAFAFSPDGKSLASAASDGTIRLWSVPSGKNTATFQAYTGQVHYVAFSPNGKTLASSAGKNPGSEDNTIKLWDVASGKNTATLQGRTGLLGSMVFSSDGKTLASGNFSGTIQLWDLASGKNTANLLGYSTAAMAFSPDGKTLASGAGPDMVQLWDVASGKNTATLHQGHDSPVYCVAFSPDGKTLASAGREKTIKLWDMASGKNTATLQGHTRWVRSVAFSPDGKRLASVGLGDLTIKLWDLPVIQKTDK